LSSAEPRSGDAAKGPYAPDGDGELRREFVERWRDNAYGCFSSGHKFCREVCPVMQVTRNENHTPTAFHANIVAMEQGLVDAEDVADDYVHCTGCGACELRCPNTLFTGDFYRHRTRTVDVVKAMRALMVKTGNERPGWRRWVERLVEAGNEPVLGEVPVEQEHVRDWAHGLDLPEGGETIMFVDCEAAFYRTSYSRAIAQLLMKAGVDFGLMREQWCCGGPAAEMGYVDQARAFAEHNVADWRAVGARRIIAPDPHDYIAFTEDYPRYFGADYEFEIVLGVELLGDLVGEGRLALTEPVERTVTYHDPCRLNKRKGVHEAPRELLRAIPGLTFRDVDHVTQWSYCSGGGGGLPVEKPEITAEISRRRVGRAAQLDVDTLVSACPWSERPLANAGDEQGLEVMDLFELVARAAGIEVGGHARAPAATEAGR
jgi:heterodisulfide reductase subunit D